MNIHLRMALTRISVGGAVLLMLQCGTDPFAGNGTTLPQGARQCGLSSVAGCGGSESVSVPGTGGQGIFGSACTGRVFVEVYVDATIYDCCTCSFGEPAYLLCSGGSFSACDCVNPGGGWTRDTGADGGVPFDGGIHEPGDSDAETGSGDAVTDVLSGEPNGAVCTSNSECASDNCAADPGWCTRACAASTDCPNSPYRMWCIEDTGGSDVCFPDCDVGCSRYGSAFSCKSFVDVEGTTQNVCST